MKRLILTLSIILATCVSVAHAQAIFKKYGFNKEPLTLSKGKYKEFFTNDEVVQIGTVKLNTRTNKVIQLLEEDTTKNNYLSDRSSIWYSVDPLAEKYPNYSPYVYCKNNPVKFIDPDGREICIAFNITNQDGSTSQQKVQYKNGSLYGTDGKPFTGKNDYVTKVQGDITQLSKDNSELSDRITTLQDSKQIHTIEMPTNAEGNNTNSGSKSKIESHTPTGSKTEYDPDKKTDTNGRVRTPRAALAHELLGHGWDKDQGKTVIAETLNGIEMKEVNAVNIGNIAGAAAGDAKKTTYGGKDIPAELLKDTHTKK
jgi:hypothetical protein